MIVKFLHISDLHLLDTFDSQTFLDPYIKRQLQWDALEKAIDFANDKKVHFLLITGDVYERNYFTTSHARRLLGLLAKFKGLRTIMIAGNHDYYDDVTVFDGLEIPNNLTIVKDKEIEKIDFPDYHISFFAHSWTKPVYRLQDSMNLFRKPFNFTEKFNVFIVHTGLESDGVYLPLNLKTLKDFDYVALGHIHKPGILGKNAAYAGSIEPLNKKETGPHGGILGEIDTKERSLVLHFCDLANSIYHKKEILVNDLDIMSITQELNEILDPNKENILSLRLKGEVNYRFSIKELEAALLANFTHVEIIDDREEKSAYSNLNEDLLNKLFDEISEMELSSEKKKRVLRKSLELLWRANP